MGFDPSRRGMSASSGRSALQEAQRWVAAHPADDHGVDRLARRTGMGPRHFARVFRAETGMTPAVYVETVRIEAVRRLLETGEVSLKQVAGACGFRDADTLRRAFMRQVGTTPAEYRRLHVAPKILLQHRAHATRSQATERSSKKKPSD
jgi:transcriptional regulator GlxA family with amidase domain